MVVTGLALVGVFLALYLSLWKLGFMGVIPCGSGECDIVQSSEYAYLFGVPVAFYGLGGYLALVVIGLVGVQPRFVDRREPTLWLIAISGLGVAFTLYLSYLEAFVINAWCRWCLVSAALIAAIFLVSLAGLRRPKGVEAGD